MVTYTGKARRFDPIRSLNKPIKVLTYVDREGLPVKVKHKGNWLYVKAIQDRWHLQDEWWRDCPIDRLYYECIISNGSLLILFNDLVSDEWYRQRLII